MKIIISRKGFDGTTGGVPSPIFEDDDMMSLPIPRKSNLPYGEIHSPYTDKKFEHFGQIAEQLTNYQLSEHCRAHLDPDLNWKLIPREPGWRGIFGQNGSFQTVLDNENVGKDDVFLFFGLFQKVAWNEGTQRYEFVRKAPEMHVLHGWLKVGDRYRIPDDIEGVPNWAKYHPHIKYDDIEDRPNVIYVAANKFASDDPTVDGWGVFRKFSEELRLSHPEPVYRNKKPKLNPSRWLLPAWMYHPELARQPLTQFKDNKDWEGSDQHGAVLYTSRGHKGQECVLDCKDYPEALRWATDLITKFCG